MEIADFAYLILKRHEEQLMQKGIEKMISESDSFNFIKEDENLYSVADVKEKM